MAMDTAGPAQATAPVPALATVFTLPLPPLAVTSVPHRPSVDASARTSSGSVRARTDSAPSDAPMFLLVGSPETGVYVSSPGVHTSLLLATTARGHELVGIGPPGAMDVAASPSRATATSSLPASFVSSTAAAAAVAAAVSALPVTVFLSRRMQPFSPKPVAAAVASSSAVTDASPILPMPLVVTPPPSPPRTSGPPHKCCGISLTDQTREKAFEPYIDQMFATGSMEEECIGRFLLFSPLTLLFLSCIQMILSVCFVIVVSLFFDLFFSVFIDLGTAIARSTQCSCRYVNRG